MLMRALFTMGFVAALAAGVMAQAQAPAGQAAPGAPPANAPAPGSVELKVGDMAPDFTLQASDGKTYRLSDYRGKQAVVVAWFPRAFTQGCTIECKSLAENGARIRQFDVSYFMASNDSVEDNTKFAQATSVTLNGRAGQTVVEKQAADFPLLADPTSNTAKAYGVLTPRNAAARWTFYIGRDGRISYIEKAVRPETSAEDMIAKLTELRIARR
jgi:peroxiredoxin Q/BCP